MLPDWAVVSFAEPPGSQYPGKIVAADFFDENWQLKTRPESATEDSGDGESAEETVDKKTDNKKTEASATNDDDAKTPTTDKTEKAENTPAAKK